jgi:hypothetical protein
MPLGNVAKAVTKVIDSPGATAITEDLTFRAVRYGESDGRHSFDFASGTKITLSYAVRQALFPTVSRRELLGFGQLATGYPSRTAAPMRTTPSEVTMIP